MGETLVVGADGSGPSRAAIDWAIARAASLDASVELVHVVDERWLGLQDAHDSEVRDHAASMLAAELNRIGMLPTGPVVTARVVVGLPSKALMDASVDADLLVIGTHKTGFTYGRAFGSKFASLASQSRCAVAFIPEMFGRTRRGVAVAADARNRGQNAIEYATAEAIRTGQDLVIIAAWEGESFLRSRTDGRAVSLATATTAARAFDARVSVRTRTSDSAMSDALITASTTASLLVLARPGTAPDDQTLATNQDVLTNISSPVIILGDPRSPTVSFVGQTATMTGLGPTVCRAPLG